MLYSVATDIFGMSGMSIIKAILVQDEKLKIALDNYENSYKKIIKIEELIVKKSALHYLGLFVIPACNFSNPVCFEVLT